MIKHMQSGDMEAALGLYLEVFWAPPFSYGDWLTRDNARRYFADNERTPGGYTMLYYAADTLCGVCMGYTLDYFVVKTYDIKEFVVRLDVQGLGHGSRMMQEVQGHLQQHHGVQAITLTTQSNMPAHKFYKKNGFRDLDKTIYMSKNI